MVERASHARTHLPFDRDKLWVLPVATRFESRIEYELAQQWLSRFSKVLAPLFDDWTHKNVMPSELLNFIKVPYIPYWSFGERIPVLEEGTKDPDSIGFALETITALLALKLSASDALIKNRDSFVATAKLSSLRQNPSPERLTKPIQIFISYSHRDVSLYDALVKHLKILERQGIISVWHDRQIGAGSDWNSSIDANLNTAQIILLLVSPDFMASDYCWDLEMKRALERHEAGEAQVIPIIVRSVDWQSTPLGDLQALPQNAQPIQNWSDQDAAWTHVAREIKQLAENFSAHAPSSHRVSIP